MDVLAQGYGSDSSDESAEKKSQTLGLLANYLDGSSSSEDEHVNDAVKNPLGTSETFAAENNESTCTTGTQPCRKKLKLSSETKPAETSCGLPPPPLLSPSSSDPSSSRDNLILFSKNYLTDRLQYKASNTDNQLQEKLERMHQHKNSGRSFAEQLKCQKDFGNPHMFPSTIEHFGIDPLVSNASNFKTTFEGFEFIDRLMVKEEENRIREAQTG